MATSSIPNLFEGQAPARDDWVLGQGFTRDLAYCKGLVPDDRMWPVELDRLPVNAEGRTRINRQLLFEIARRVVNELSQADPWPATQLHAAITFWGAPPGQSATRATRPFSDVNVAPRLAEAIALIRGDGVASAYRALSRRQRLWIPGLGPSYFTKLMYFAGFGAKPYLSQPLIMDDNVVAGLRQVTGRQWEASLEHYIRYVDLAKDWAYECETEPDVVERRLFEIGS